MAGQGSALSLEDAVKEKYCVPPEEDRETLPARKTIKESGLRHKPDVTPVQRRSSVVLDHRGVTHVGSEVELSQLCPSVEELVLAANAISHWRDVCALLSLPRLSLLDLSRNPLSSVDPTPSGANSPPSSGTADDTGDSDPTPSDSIDPTPSSASGAPSSSTGDDSDTGDRDPTPSGPIDPTPFPVVCRSLNTLALNCTGIEWSALQLALDVLPCLQELHLSKNNYLQVNFDPAFQHKSLKRLHINNNSLSDWREIEKLSPAFPNLQILVATSNPLSEIPPPDPCVFPELSSLNLNGAKISKWKCIEQLNALASIKDLSLLKLPLAASMEEKTRRFAIVARLPKLRKLNKSDISESEREDAERWLIRQCEKDPSRPAVYDSLVTKYGSLNPLAAVDMTPKPKANIEFCYDDRRSEIHCIKLNQSTSSLKKWVSQRIGATPSNFRLCYFNIEYSDWTLMRYNSKRLYSYDMKDGDQIHVQMLKKLTLAD